MVLMVNFGTVDCVNNPESTGKGSCVFSCDNGRVYTFFWAGKLLLSIMKFLCARSCFLYQQQVKYISDADQIQLYVLPPRDEDKACYLVQSQYTYTGPTSPSSKPMTPTRCLQPGVWRGSQWNVIYKSQPRVCLRFLGLFCPPCIRDPLQKTTSLSLNYFPLE